LGSFYFVIEDEMELSKKEVFGLELSYLIFMTISQIHNISLNISQTIDES